MDDERELWDPAQQAQDSSTMASVVGASIAQEWDRIWDQPLPFYQRKFEGAGLRRSEVPPLVQVPDGRAAACWLQPEGEPAAPPAVRAAKLADAAIVQ